MKGVRDGLMSYSLCSLVWKIDFLSLLRFNLGMGNSPSRMGQTPQQPRSVGHITLRCGTPSWVETPKMYLKKATLVGALSPNTNMLEVI